MLAAKSSDHQERSNRDSAQRETGITRERRLENADRIAGQAVIVCDRAIERGGSPCLSLAIDRSFDAHRNASESPRKPDGAGAMAPVYDRASSFAPHDRD
jgi:hypothetical protein